MVNDWPDFDHHHVDRFYIATSDHPRNEDYLSVCRLGFHALADADARAIAALPDWIAAADAARAEVARLRKVIEAARPVLEWYADPENNHARKREFKRDGRRVIDHLPSLVAADHGAKSREALAMLERLEGER